MKASRKAALSGFLLLVAVFALTAAASAQIGDHQVFITVWDNSQGLLLGDATVIATLPNEIPAKAVALPSGSYYIEGVGAKTMLEVDQPEFGSVEFEVSLPDNPSVWLDVRYYSYRDASLWIDGEVQGGEDDPVLEPPPNDLCENAIGPLEIPSVTPGTTSEATIDSEFPTCVTSITSPGVWYTVIGTGTTITASTCGPLFTYDTKISVYCQDCDGQVCVTGNDDDCIGGASGLLSTVTWCSQAGAEYLILVHGFGGGSGDFELFLSEDGVPCEPDVECIATGACCLPDGTCLNELSQEECEAQEGTYQGDDTRCEGGFVEYLIEPCGNLFEDISATGNPGPTGDDVGIEVPIGFSFNFFGDLHDMVAISTNGYLTFGADWTDFSNDPCATSLDPNDAIFVFWDDYDQEDGGQIYYETRGMVPDRRLIVQWDAVAEFGTSGADFATFQAILFEGSNTIEFRYGELVGVPSFDEDVTVGVENQDGTVAFCIDGDEIMEGDCWSWTPVFEDPIECPAEIEAFMDIKPTSCPNPLNRRSQGVLPVALLGTDDFDVMEVDLLSLMLSRADGVGGMVPPLDGPPGPGFSYEDVATPFEGELCDCHELGPDGFTDLSMKFKTQNLVDVLELGDLPSGEYVELVLSGTLLDGMPFSAGDCILLVPRVTGIHNAR